MQKTFPFATLTVLTACGKVDKTAYLQKGLSNLEHEIRRYGRNRNSNPRTDRIGEKAPDRALPNAAGEIVSLGDFKSRILLIHFTGIGCGACYRSIPFLKCLKTRYPADDFDLAAIETRGKTGHSLPAYINRNKPNFELLDDDSQTPEAYCPDRSVPVFILLDEDRTVRDIFRGIRAGKTDTKIPKPSKNFSMQTNRIANL